MARKASRAGPRPGTSGGGCPWAQDDDAGQFTRGPPSRAKRGNQRAETAQATQAPRTFKPAAQSGVPWATEDQSSWGQPANAIGAGLGCGRSTRTPPHERRYDCGGAGGNGGGGGMGNICFGISAEGCKGWGRLRQG